MPNEENPSPENVMEQIRLKLIAMGYVVRSSINSPNLWYATSDTKGELHAVILEDERVRVNDINGRHWQEGKAIEREVNQCLNQ